MIGFIVITLVLGSIFLLVSIWAVSKIARTSMGSAPRNIRVIFTSETRNYEDPVHQRPTDPEISSLHEHQPSA